MSDSRTFPGVTPEILSRMKELGRAEYNIVYDPPDGPVGTATSQTPLGECVIEGVRTTIPFLRRVIASDEFRQGRVHTQMLEQGAFNA